MACGVYWQQVHTADRALADLERLGLGPGTEAYGAVLAKRGELMATIGYKFPRVPMMWGVPLYLSPSYLRAWLDPEVGWMVEAREKPGASSVYRSVPAEVAVAIIKGEVTPELKMALLEPDEYLGE